MNTGLDLLTVTHDHRGDTLVVHVAGEIDMLTGPTLECALGAACAKVEGQVVRLVVDLTGVRFIGSTGVHLLAATRMRCAERGIPLVVVASACHVLKVLRITGEDGQLRVADTVDEVLDAVPGS